MKDKEDVKGKIRAMEVGDVIEVAIEMVCSVRVYASELGLTLNRVYKTQTDRERRVVTVTRES